MIETLGVKNAEKIVPISEDMKPVDPVTENMNIMRGKPVKAFLIQDHEAHLGVHMTAMRDPKLAQVMGQNPQAQAIMAAAQAHVMEHVAFQYRKEIEKMLGAVLPPMHEDNDEEGLKLPPEMEAQLAQLAAKAAEKLLQKNTAETQQQQAQQQAQDPLVQMQQKELQIKESEVQRKAAKDKMDAAGKADEIRLKEEDLKLKQQSTMIAAAGKADEIRLKEQDTQHKHRNTSNQQMIDLTKHREQITEQQRQRAIQQQKPTDKDSA
jgi:hypothetical protein